MSERPRRVAGSRGPRAGALSRSRSASCSQVALDDHTGQRAAPARACSRPAVRPGRTTPQHQQRVVVAVEGLGVADFVGRDQSRFLASSLARACCSTELVSAANPTTNGRGALALTCARMSVVRVSSSADRLAGLLDLLRRAGTRPVIGHGRGADEDRGSGQFALHGCVHLLGAFDIDTPYARAASSAIPGR